MTALLGKVNQFSDQGCTFSANLAVLSGNTPLDLTGYTANGAVKTSFDAPSNTTIAFSVSIPQPNTGIIVISLDANTTENMDYGRYFYDVTMTSPANVVTKVIEGTFVLDPTATGN